MYNRIMNSEENNKNELVENFKEYLKIEKNYSPNTINSYEIDLYELLDFLNKKLNEVVESDILDYLNFLYNENKKRTSISRKISTFKSFYKYLMNKKEISLNPMDYITYPKKEKKLPSYLEYNELEDMLNSISSSRNRLIIELLYATGIRVSELVGIKISDIDLEELLIRVIGKGSKERIVYFGEYALDALNEYINTDRNIELKSKKSEWLFPGKREGKNLTTRTVEYIINEIINNVSTKSNVSPHTLRHTFATHMLNSGCDIRVVQELLGHESLNTTEVYTHISDESIRNTYLKCHGRK